MAADDLIVGLDIGTTKVCAVIGQLDERGGVEIIGVGTTASRGLRRGVVINIDATVKAIMAAIEDAEERTARYEELVERAYDRSRALNSGVSFGVDDVIDPMDTRHWISNALSSVPKTNRRLEKKRRNVDTW